ncbi:MAG TPA: penicillin acylase family protein [Burkholderiaceae bacterium]|nr:penicillin acylase family protein [Burkholderiaceae bacterium]
MPRWVRWSAAGIGGVLALLFLALAIAAWAVYRSLPELDGRSELAGLASPATIRRDALGTAVIQASNRLDAARALGFVHAQERFFDMDLARRSAAGELSALFGKIALERDKTRRMHRLRARLTARYALMDAADRALLEAYTQGVNAGLSQLADRPWPYLLLRARPQPWQAVDSLLVIGEMYWMLQGSSLDGGFERAWLRERLGDARFDWLEPHGGHWDAALDGSIGPALALPDAGLFDTRAASPPGTATSASSAPAASEALPADAAAATASPPTPSSSSPSTPSHASHPTSSGLPASLASPDAPSTPAYPSHASASGLSLSTWAASVLASRTPPDEVPEGVLGSNQWAVAGSRTDSGAAMLANDMHLALGVPSIWFRAQFEIGRGGDALRATGVTLPGLPAMVVGANGAVAWGFTNAYGQWFDWIRIPPELPARRLTHVQEHIAVKGEAEVVLDVVELDGDPIVREADGIRYAVHWIADDGAAYTLALDELLGARDVQAALAIAHRCGMPHQNFMVADRAGHIAWTVAGRLWTGSRAAAWARFLAPEAPRPAWRDPADAPVVIDPPGGQLWTANNRTLGGAEALALGDGGFDLGARAQQIRDRLGALTVVDEPALERLQLDDEARFMQGWAGRVAAATDGSPRHAEVLALLRGWNGRADADEAAYRLVRGVRLRTLDALWAAWALPFLGPPPADSAPRVAWHARFEYAAALALDQRPLYLLPRPYETWDAFLLAQVDAEVDAMTGHGLSPLADASWGQANASHIRHVLSRAVPALAALLDMPSVPQGGDGNLPHVTGPNFGQSERLVVTPGHEARATLSMPGGQSGHPMSPYYGAGHQDWVDHVPTPLLAGRAQHTLALVPAATP